jgi:hypothetical protein
MGLSTSPEVLVVGGVSRFPALMGVGWVALMAAKGGKLRCICDSSGGGSWKFGRLEAADRRAVKLVGSGTEPIAADGAKTAASLAERESLVETGRGSPGEGRSESTG